MSDVTLNPQQTHVVDTEIDASTRVMAGAGTGKTRVLVERYLKFLEHDDCRPGDLLALTFTLKAAAEMRTRIHEEVRARFPHLVEEMHDAWIMNFHQFGLRLMRENAPAFGVDPGAGVVSDTDARTIELALRNRYLAAEIASLAPDFGGEIPTPARMATRFDLIYKTMMKCRDEMRPPAELLDYVEPGDTDAYVELVRSIGAMMDAYGEELHRRNLVDFNDMISIPATALGKDAALRRRLAGRFRHILVDEYQDTSVAQDRMLRLLTADGPEGEGARRRVTVVGDVKQAIYRFRNAKVENILGFPGTELPLADNYRSTQPVLDLAHEFVKRQKGLEPAPLRSTRPGAAAPVVVFHPEGEGRDREREAGALAAWVHHLTTGEPVEGMPDVLGGAAPLDSGEVTVLLRGLSTGYGLRAIETALAAAHIPYAIVGGASGPEAHALETWHALLSLLMSGEHGQALLMILEREPFALEDESLMHLFPNQRDAASLEQVLSEERIASLSDPRAEHAVRELSAFIDDMRRHWESLDLMSFLEWTIESSPFALHLLEGGLTERAVTDLPGELLRVAHDLERRDSLDLRTYLDFVRTIVDARKFGEESEQRLPPGRVRIMTIHQAKGLEFKAVALAGVKSPPTSRDGFHISRERGLLLGSADEYKPWDRAYAKDPHHEHEKDMRELEESCLIYVGITRAEDYLFVSSPYPDGVEKTKAWRFADVIAAAGEVETVVECRRIVSPSSAAKAKVAAASAQSPAEALALRTAAREHIARWREHGAGERADFISATWADLEPRVVEAGESLGDAQPVEIPGGLAPAEYGTFVHEVMRAMLSGTAADALACIEQEAGRFGYVGGRRQAVVAATQALVASADAAGAFERGKEMRLEEPFQVRVGPALLGGVFDRIERSADGWRVVDYKVGTPAPAHRAQVAYYMWALGRITGEAVRGELWYLRGDDVHVVDVRDPAVDDIAAAVEAFAAAP